jgi:hypothetical protein
MVGVDWPCIMVMGNQTHRMWPWSGIEPVSSRLHESWAERGHSRR